jgi:hypothetical protein
MERLNGHSAAARKGDWSCACGQAFRVLAIAGEVRMWARNSSEGYALEPIGEDCLCGLPIARGTVLSALFGANVAEHLLGPAAVT